MRLTRVFVEGPLQPGGELVLPSGAATHLTRVLRLGAGAACVLFDGRGGEYPATLVAVDRREVRVRVDDHVHVERESPLRVLLLQGLARGERMDVVVQKATELGVAAIQPVVTQYSAVKLDATQAARKVEHWRAVAIGACEQCRRNRIPDIRAPLALDRALVDAPPGARVVLSVDEGQSLARAVRGAPGAGTGEAWISVLVGPEGGLSAAEEMLAQHAGFVPVRLGPRVLRTETAGPACLAALGALVGDLAGGADAPSPGR